MAALSSLTPAAILFSALCFCQDEPSDFLKQARDHAAAGRDQDAIGALEKFVESLRQKPQGRSLVADAARIAEVVRARNAGDFRSAFQCAELLFLAGRYEETLAALASVAASGQSSADYYNLAGMTYAAMNDLATASRALIKAIELAPERADLLINLAGLYQKARDNKAALLALNKAVAMPSAPPAAFFALALTHYNLGHFQSTVENCGKATALDPNFDRAFLLMGRAYASLGKPADAARALRRAVALNPACDACQFELALLASSSAESERLLRAALAINPRNAAARSRLGKQLSEQHRDKEALVELEQAIALDPDQDAAYYQLGALYRKRGEAAKSRAIFNALRDRKEHRRVQSEAGMTQAQSMRRPE